MPKSRRVGRPRKSKSKSRRKINNKSKCLKKCKRPYKKTRTAQFKCKSKCESRFKSRRKSRKSKSRRKSRKSKSRRKPRKSKSRRKSRKSRKRKYDGEGNTEDYIVKLKLKYEGDDNYREVLDYFDDEEQDVMKYIGKLKLQRHFEDFRLNDASYKLESHPFSVKIKLDMETSDSKKEILEYFSRNKYLFSNLYEGLEVSKVKIS